MATYNGASYIDQQLRSILCQLKEQDEVILVDDRSSDLTVEIAKGFGDDRIKIFINNANQGILKTFERAIRLASGDVIYLSDQDDVWYPSKVARFSDVFKLNPDVLLVLSDAELINDKGEVTARSFFEKRGTFTSSLPANILKNKYLGCTMAFRSSIVGDILPFPANIPMHDMWIGCISAFYGKVRFLDMPLMAYRRHENNASPAHRQNFLKMLHWRLQLIKNLYKRICR